MPTSSRNDRVLIRRLLNIVIRDPASVPNLSIGELDLALRLTRRVRLLGRLGASLESAGLMSSLPPVAADHLQGGMAMAGARSRLALWELDRISWAMGPHSTTPLVVMKGCTYLLLNLPNAPGRIFADVDLLTTEAELEEVEATLNAKGWVSSELTPYDQNYYRKWTHELPPLVHEEREVEIDLHHNIMPRTARLNPDPAKLLERARSVPDSRYRVLADEDIVLHAMTHLMFDGDLADKLRDLVDVCDLLEYFSGQDTGFWQKLCDRAEELDLTRPVFYSLRYMNRLLNVDVPEFVLDSSKKWAPPGIIVSLMDRLMPLALYPQHPDRPSRLTEGCRLLLYIRSHWIKMPPWLLIYHLAYKFIRTRLPQQVDH